METVTIVELLRGLAGVGSIGVAVWILALVGPKIPWFVALDDLWKRIVMFLISAIIALIAWALLQYVPDSLWLSIEQPFKIVMLIVFAVFGNQLVHRVGPKLSRVAKLADHNAQAIIEMPHPTAMGQTVADVDRIRSAGMLVPDNIITPSMSPHEVIEALQRVKDHAAKQQADQPAPGKDA